MVYLDYLFYLFFKKGVKQLKQSSRLHPKFIFLAPPSIEVLETRIRERGTDSDEAIRRRLAQAKIEMEYSQIPGVHDRIIVNDDLERAYKEVRDFVSSDTINTDAPSVK